MNVIIKVSRNLAYAAVCNAEARVTSRRAFQNIVTNYVRIYGEMCMHDHEAEARTDIAKKANEIVAKYYID
jgi:hypothetical protein